MSSEYFLVKRGSTALANRVVLDKTLSFTALGVLATLLALPPEAPKGYRALLGRGLGEKAVRNALTELADHGFRHQFRTRTTGGQLRTVTVISDEPIDEDQARQVVRARNAGYVLPTKQAAEETPQNPRSDRAATGAARSDLHVYNTQVEEKQDEDPPTEPRSTVPRSTVARSTTAQLAKANSKEAKASQPNQTPTSGDRSGLVGQKNRTGSPVAAPSGAAPPDSNPMADRDLVAECLPEHLQAVDSGGLAMVATLLRERLDAGWTAKTIRQVMDQPLPSQVGRLAAIVGHRLRANVDPASPPAMARQKRRAVAAERPSAPHEAAWDQWIWDPTVTEVGGRDASTPREIISAGNAVMAVLQTRGLSPATWPGFWAEAVQARPDLDPEEPEAWPDLVEAARELALQRVEVAS